MTKPLDNDFKGQKQPETPMLPFDPAQVDRCGIRLTRAEFARFLGVSRQAVGEWASAGKITLGADGRLDPRQAVGQLLRNSDPARLRARALRPLVRDVGMLQRRVAELEAEVAHWKEEAEFSEGAAGELAKVPDAMQRLLAEEWAKLRTIEPGEIGATLDDLYRRACDLAAWPAELLLPGVNNVFDMKPQERAWALEMRDFDAQIEREAIEASRASRDIEGGEGRE